MVPAYRTGSISHGAAKHYLGAPVPGATVASVNLAHVVTAVEFVAAEFAEQSDDAASLSSDEILLEESEPALEAIAKSRS